LLDPQKFTQIGIFGLKTNHLATLIGPSKTGKSYPSVIRRPVQASRHEEAFKVGLDLFGELAAVVALALDRVAGSDLEF
jgi:hypothetical protein